MLSKRKSSICESKSNKKKKEKVSSSFGKDNIREVSHGITWFKTMAPCFEHAKQKDHRFFFRRDKFNCKWKVLLDRQPKEFGADGKEKKKKEPISRSYGSYANKHDFLDLYDKLDSEYKIIHELVREDQKVYCFFDLEWLSSKKQSRKDENFIVEHFKTKHVLPAFKKIGHTVDVKNAYFQSFASRMKANGWKSSYHIVIKDTIFDNINVLNAFVEFLLMPSVLADEKMFYYLNPEGERKCLVDVQLYHVHGSLRMPGSRKDTDAFSYLVSLESNPEHETSQSMFITWDEEDDLSMILNGMHITAELLKDFSPNEEMKKKVKKLTARRTKKSDRQYVVVSGSLEAKICQTSGELIKKKYIENKSNLLSPYQVKNSIICCRREGDIQYLFGRPPIPLLIRPQ